MGLGSDSSPVKIQLNNHDIYLADSMQFCLEIGARLNKRGAYYIMPSFRGENVDERHLNEFAHSEVEIKGFLTDIMNLAEEYIKYMVQNLLDELSEEISLIAGTTEHLKIVIDKKFQCIHYQDALQELERHNGANSDMNGIPNITSKGEKILLSKYGDFTWLTNLPFKLVPFYQAQDKDNPKYSYSADLLAGIGEILGSGQRVLTVEDLENSLAQHKVGINNYLWYREMRKISTIQTSGFGLGIERFILWILKHNDIRDCTLLLRNHKELLIP
jgi:aspartyl/asparaginyl-tRNA synthetase